LPLATILLAQCSALPLPIYDREQGFSVYPKVLKEGEKSHFLLE